LEGREVGEGEGEGNEAGEAKAGEWTTHRVKPLVDGGVFHAEGLSFCGVGRYANFLGRSPRLSRNRDSAKNHGFALERGENPGF
jgi:hypothetical protein